MQRSCLPARQMSPAAISCTRCRSGSHHWPTRSHWRSARAAKQNSICWQIADKKFKHTVNQNTLPCAKRLRACWGVNTPTFQKGQKVLTSTLCFDAAYCTWSTAAPLHALPQITGPPNWTAAQGQALTLIAGSLVEALRPCPSPQSSQPLCRLLLPPLPRLPADVLARGAGATLEGGGAT